MVFPLFRSNKKKELEKRFTTFSEQLAQAFGQIKTDISETNSRLQANQAEMERIGQWVEYLNRSNQRLTEANAKILEKYEKISENHQNLHSSHSQLRAEHSATAEMAQNAHRRAQELENRHQELSGTISSTISSTISGHGQQIKSEVLDNLKQQKEAYEAEMERLKTWVDYLSAHMDRQKGKEDDLRQDIAKRQQNWMESYSRLRELVNALKSENSELKGHVSGVRTELDSAKSELQAAIEALRNTQEDLSGTRSDLDTTRSILDETRESIKNSSISTQTNQSAPISERSEQVQPPPVAPQAQVQPQAQPTPTIIHHVSAPQSSFQRHILSRVMPNRKGYVLRFILDLVKEGQYSTKEVEEVVVAEKQLCGRTSFYAYLKELKLKGRLAYAEIDERTVLVNTDSQQTLTKDI